MPPPDADRVRDLWRELTDAPGAFTPRDPLVIASDTHRASPPAWIGIVEVCGDVVVACRTATADRVRRQLAGSAAEHLIRPSIVDALLHPVDTLGPALLFYGRPTLTATKAAGSVIGPCEIDDPRVQSVIGDATTAELDETAIEETTSGVYVGLTADGIPAAACAWREWPHRVAHISALTAASYRGLGFGASTAAVALDAAVGVGLLPQWRAGHWNEASIALARRLGLELLGHQYSLLLN